jgi:hypothetical protein
LHTFSPFLFLDPARSPVVSTRVSQVVDVYRALRSIDQQELDEHIANLEDELAVAKSIRLAQELIHARQRADSYIPATDLSRQERREPQLAATLPVPTPPAPPARSEPPDQLDAAERTLCQGIYRLLVLEPRTLEQLQDTLSVDLQMLNRVLNYCCLFEYQVSRTRWRLLPAARRIKAVRAAAMVVLAAGPNSARGVGEALGLPSGHIVGQSLSGSPHYVYETATKLWRLSPSSTVDSAA